MKEKVTQFVYASVVAFLLVGFAGSVQAWVSPKQAPPAGNVSTPINTGSVTQQKKGILGVDGLGVFGQSIFNGTIKIVDGTQEEGKFLMSDAQGNATWQYPPPVPTCNTQAQAECPSGSTQMSINGQTFCGYSKSGGRGTTYCNGKDTLIYCEDMGVGKNHGVNPFANGCTAWEGNGNNGGSGAMLYCKSGPAPLN